MFEGFNFKEQSAIDCLLTAQQIIDWDHDEDGEAEFWPAGNHAGVALLFSHATAVTGSELLALDALLQELGDESDTAFLKIAHALAQSGKDISTVGSGEIEDLSIHIYEGTSFIDLRKEAAWDLFELYYPDDYRTVEKSQCDGVIFDVDRFLDSPCWCVEEFDMGNYKAIAVSPQ